MAAAMAVVCGLGAAAAGPLTTVINEPPAGKQVLYSRASKAYRSTDGENAMPYNDNGSVVKMVTDGDGTTVYMSNAVTGVDQAWIWGTKLNSGNIEFKLPQCVVEADNGVYYYAAAMIQDGNKLIPRTMADQKYVLIPDGKGGYEADEDGVFIGLIDIDSFETITNYNWNGHAIFAVRLTPHTAEPVAPAAGLTTETWGVINGTTGYKVEVGVSGTDMWVKGLCQTAPELWAKGTIDGEKVVFDSDQYMGIDESNLHFAYFSGGYGERRFENNRYEYKITNDGLTEFNYDAQKKQLTPVEDSGFMILGAPVKGQFTYDSYTGAPKQGYDAILNFFYPYNMVVNPIITVQDAESTLPPMKPEILGFGNYDQQGYGHIYVLVNSYDTAYNLIDPTDLYWNFMVGADPYEVRITQDGAFRRGFDIPFEMSSNDDVVVNNGFMEVVCRNISQSKYGVRSFRGTTGTPDYSELATAKNPWFTAVEAIEAAEGDGVYYDLMGRRVVNPERGIYIRDGKKVVL